MAGEPDGPPVVAVPRRLDRSLRLGPFPSARDALKFLFYAAAGAFLAPFASPVLWLPIVGAGFVVSVWRPDGVALDELGWQALGWHWRARAEPIVSAPSEAPAVVAGAFVRLPTGNHAAVVRCSGVPLAYRPPADLERTFDQYRTLLRTLTGPVALRVSLAPLPAGPHLPSHPEGVSEPERVAEAGYHELVTLLCRRRSVRRIDIALFGEGPRGVTADPLEQRLRTLVASLEALGLRPRRLRGSLLADSARGFGWTAAEAAG